MKTYRATIELEVTAESTREAEEEAIEYLQTLIDDGSIYITIKPLS